MSILLMTVLAYFVELEVQPEKCRNSPNEVVNDQKFDWLGAFTGVVGLALFYFA
jgi:hypothetical protein